MINTVLDTIKKHNMLSVGDRVVVGVSGGADSMALLHILIALKDELGIEIVVAHIEHGIRGDESVEDAEFVKGYCNSNNIEFHMLSIDAEKQAQEKGMGVEEYSRKVRYDFFNSLSPDKIATAHNLNDNVETLVFRLIRGTGLKGACGIPAVRENIIRPLLDVTSDDIREYCRKNDIEYRVDSTNLTDDYTRNFIRNTLLPAFSNVNSNYISSLSSFINDTNEDYELLSSLVECGYKECIDDNKLNIEKLKSYHISVIKRIIIKYFEDNSVPIDRLHLDGVLPLLYKSSKLQIKNDIFAVSDKRHLRLVRFNKNIETADFFTQILKINEFDSKTVDFYCDYDKINGDIVLRKRMAGDTICPAKRNCTKSLKKLFNELMIPVEERDNINVICDSDGVIGVIGYCVDERVRLDEGTENILIVNIHSED